MPFIELETNVKVEDRKALLTKLSKLSSHVLAKPESLVLVKYTHNEDLCFNGTFEPAFVLIINSIGSFTSPEKNASFVGDYTKFLKEDLGVDDKRGYIGLRDPGSDTTGYAGTTITKLFSK